MPSLTVEEVSRGNVRTGASSTTIWGTLELICRGEEVRTVQVSIIIMPILIQRVFKLALANASRSKSISVIVCFV